MNEHKPKPPAASHMIWFFVLPCLAFVGWASWSLLSQAKSTQNVDTLETRLESLEEARSAGDRWQAAYGLSQKLQGMKASGEWGKLPPEKKQTLFRALGDLLKKHGSDARFKRYLLMTLGEFGDPSALDILQAGLQETDPELVFFSAWGFAEILLRHPEFVNGSRFEQVEQWLSDEDMSLQKIGIAFMAQQGSQGQTRIEGFLANPTRELRWSAAVALASQKNLAAAPVLAEIFDITELRAAAFRTSEDLTQLVASAVDAALRLQDSEVLQKAQALKSSIDKSTPEGRSIDLGLSALGLATKL